MPKKKSSSKKKVKEIKKKRKEIKKKFEESDLEKDIEKREDVIEESEFQEFLQPTQVSAPVLTKVETATQEPLESTIASTPISQSKEKETKIDYIARNEPKYSNITTEDNLDEKKNESEIRPPVLRQTESGRFRQEILTPQREAGTEIGNVSEGIETSTLEQRRTEPFETQEKKYREVKF